MCVHQYSTHMAQVVELREELLLRWLWLWQCLCPSLCQFIHNLVQSTSPIRPEVVGRVTRELLNAKGYIWTYILT